MKYRSHVLEDCLEIIVIHIIAEVARYVPLNEGLVLIVVDAEQEALAFDYRRLQLLRHLLCHLTLFEHAASLLQI